MTNAFSSKTVYIHGNDKIRTPQIEAFQALESHYEGQNKTQKEVGIILPVGCGKSGCITITPFAFKSKRTLVIAPGLHISSQLLKDFDPSNQSMFYRKCKIISDNNFPEPVEIRGDDANLSDLEEAEVVITNIQQLQGGSENRWLKDLPNDFFDLILFDEGHHSIASSFMSLKQHFPKAFIVNYSATPLRADGQLMAGEIIYTYPIFKAIKNGYVKRLKAVQLNPKTLKFVRDDSGIEVEITLDEVKRLGEEDSKFRRGIVTSKETLTTIIDASIHELNRLREETSESRLKIIASALNYDHCRQVVEAYRARGLRADYVHSREDSTFNQRVMNKLNQHELDVIVQVRKLGEGFDHPYLSVAAIFSIFNNLSPFVQFVGRIMRVIEQNNSQSILNQGVVVFHAGANIAKQWGDFQQFSEADKEFFDQLLPLEDFTPDAGGDTKTIEPTPRDETDKIEVKSQTDVTLEEISLYEDTEALEALKILQRKGYSEEEVSKAFKSLEPIYVTKQRERQAKRSSLDTLAMNEARKLLAKHNINPAGKGLDPTFQKTNLIYIKSQIDKKINALVSMPAGSRSDFSRQQLELIDSHIDKIIAEVGEDIENGKN
ncbi:DEAD/DEAH box helicase [Salmonella enterica]|uniref:DEAD/DEAH box helicase n=1 Tax=Enterobacter roggenkampii TaxID=1812935 RepID=UPI001271A45E|nr:DEAD/DEAH box helicase family protein [Enterobacter roggenkampii]EAP4532319.1 DEAD/DEAH box helicase [Salmonella enterica]EBW8002919.1 DEAD/DEAH box helicase [Salmonella enterica subsp. enterica serovar Javiana]ECI6211604.1 DEAD/DEAH box helicase [Salmonella enterica subsp. enterica]EFI6375465.1 DEAD/DEAH box helicase [Escherichia coli]EAT8228222.1 DEAD/DEAH box helicase [Salmonella enterica]